MNDYGNQYSGSAGMPVKEIVVAIVLVIAIITGTVFSVGVDIAIRRHPLRRKAQRLRLTMINPLLPMITKRKNRIIRICRI